MKIFAELRQIFKDKSWIISATLMFCNTFYFTLFRKIIPYVGIDHILKIRTIIRNKLFYTILPFRVCNHIWLSIRSQHERNMCLICTKIYLRNKKLSKVIDKELTVDVLNYFPIQLSYRVISEGFVNFFIHSAVMNLQKLYDEKANVETFLRRPLILRFCCGDNILTSSLGLFSITLTCILCLFCYLI